MKILKSMKQILNLSRNYTTTTKKIFSRVDKPLVDDIMVAGR
jgi:hypothetical protein